jgi:hypothetical protein
MAYWTVVVNRAARTAKRNAREREPKSVAVTRCARAKSFSSIAPTLRGQFPVGHSRGDFKVQPERAIVETCGADGTPGFVDQRNFLVHEPVLVTIDCNPGYLQLPMRCINWAHTSDDYGD